MARRYHDRRQAGLLLPSTLEKILAEPASVIAFRTNQISTCSLQSILFRLLPQIEIRLQLASLTNSARLPPSLHLAIPELV